MLIAISKTMPTYQPKACKLPALLEQQKTLAGIKTAVAKQTHIKYSNILHENLKIYLHDLTHSIFHIGSKSKRDIWRQIVNPNALSNDLNGLLGHNAHFLNPRCYLIRT
jgi:hypothetical protein